MQKINKEFLKKYIGQILSCPKPVVFIEGTGQIFKYPIAIIALLLKAEQEKGNYLFRLNGLCQDSLDQFIYQRIEDDLKKDIEDIDNLIKKLKKNRTAFHNDSTIYFDTLDRKTQRKTPGMLSGALMYPARDMSYDDVRKVLSMTNNMGPVYLFTETDIYAGNKNDSWIDRLPSSRIVIHDPDSDIHKRVLKLKDHKDESEYIS